MLDWCKLRLKNLRNIFKQNQIIRDSKMSEGLLAVEAPSSDPFAPCQNVAVSPETYLHGKRLCICNSVTGEFLMNDFDLFLVLADVMYIVVCHIFWWYKLFVSTPDDPGRSCFFLVIAFRIQSQRHFNICLRQAFLLQVQPDQRMTFLFEVVDCISTEEMLGHQT